MRTLSSTKNGLPSVRSISTRLSGSSRGLAQQGVEQFLGALRRQRVDPELQVVGLAPPGVLVLGPVVDQQQDARRREALHQAVEKRLGLGVDPVQVLEDHQERLDLALPQQQPLEGVEGALPALGRVERLPRGVVDRHIQQRQERRRVGSSAGRA